MLFSVPLLGLMQFPNFVHATTLINSGWEAGEITDDGIWTAHGYEPIAQGSVVHSGSYAAEFSYSSSGAYSTFSAKNTLYAQFFFRYDANPASGVEYEIGSLDTTYLTGCVIAYVKNVGGTIYWVLEWRNPDFSYSNVSTSSVSPTADTWFNVTVEWHANTANGAKMYVDNTLILTSTGTTINQGITEALLINIPSSGSPANLFYDDVFVSDVPFGTEASNYYLNVLASTDGSTSPTTGLYEYAVGAITSVTATADSGHMFNYWLLDGVCYGNKNPLYITMDSNHSLEAVFIVPIEPNPSTKTTSEIRGALMKYIWDYSHNDEVICQTLLDYGFNTVVMEVPPTSWTGFVLKDFQSMATACDTYGLNLYVLLKFGTYDPTYTDSAEASYPYGFSGSNPDWRAVDNDGNYVNWCCFQRNSTRERIEQFINTILIEFPTIDGLIFDYIRYPTTDMISTPDINYKVCYCDECKAAFQQWLTASGKTFTGDWADYYYGGSNWQDYAAWRINPITNIIIDVEAWARALNPQLLFGASLWTPYSPGWVPDMWIDYMGQDSPFWISQNLFDFISPMNYVGTLAALQDRMNLETQYWLGNENGLTLMVPFITQGGSGSDVGSPVSYSFWAQEIDYIRNHGANGFIVWRYSGPGLDTDWTDIEPYLFATQSDTAKGCFSTFQQYGISVFGSVVYWFTTNATISSIEYSSNPLFNASGTVGTYLAYVDIDYNSGSSLSNSTLRTNHFFTVPIAAPFYFRISNNDSDISLYSLTYYDKGSWGSYRTLIVEPTVTEQGSAYPSPGEHSYLAGDNVTLMALPNYGYSFLAWEIDGVNETTTESSWYIIMSVDHTAKVYFNVSESTSSPGLPSLNVNWIWQYLFAGDFIGFFGALLMMTFGTLDLAVGVISMMFFVPLYLRTKSLLLLCITWILLGSFLIALMPIVSSIAVLFMGLGIAGLLYRLFRPSHSY